MKNAAEFAQNLIERARRMQEFRIVKTQPENFVFNGRVPFDVKIEKNIDLESLYNIYVNYKSISV
jgi:hypothetical protein